MEEQEPPPITNEDLNGLVAGLNIIADLITNMEVVIKNDHARIGFRDEDVLKDRIESFKKTFGSKKEQTTTK